MGIVASRGEVRHARHDGAAGVWRFGVQARRTGIAETTGEGTERARVHAGAAAS